eukprot:scaffold189_cov249-Pinguiococcus_pyrenoidosus.AAC.14
MSRGGRRIDSAGSSCPAGAQPKTHKHHRSWRVLRRGTYVELLDEVLDAVVEVSCLSRVVRELLYGSDFNLLELDLEEIALVQEENPREGGKAILKPQPVAAAALRPRRTLACA